MSYVDPNKETEVDFQKLFVELKKEIPLLFKRALQISLLASSMIVTYLYFKAVPATLFSAFLFSACYIGEKLHVPFIKAYSCFSSIKPLLESLIYDKCPDCGGYKRRKYTSR